MMSDALPLNDALDEIMRRVPTLTRYQKQDSFVVEFNGEPSTSPAYVTFYAGRRKHQITLGSPQMPTQMSIERLDAMVAELDTWVQRKR